MSSPGPPPRPAGCRFRPQYLDFRKGIHVGNLEDDERITRILKLALEARYGESFVTERYGRGVYWRWIGFLARSNREAKPLSSHVSFGCAKFFLSVEPEEALFKCGLQVERGIVAAPRGHCEWQLQKDWDWNRLIRGLRSSSALDAGLRRLSREGFHILAGSWGSGGEAFGRARYPGAAKLKQLLLAAPADEWAGLQVYYPMTEAEVRATTGPDLVDAMLAAFDEVADVHNLLADKELFRKPSRTDTILRK
ncbi:MAG: hypothetical protein IT159_00505 [Bryobacterales bacterium]|nr:hypothetical protein [Bryobacterales bacterium]